MCNFQSLWAGDFDSLVAGSLALPESGSPNLKLFCPCAIAGNVFGGLACHLRLGTRFGIGFSSPLPRVEIEDSLFIIPFYSKLG